MDSLFAFDAKILACPFKSDGQKCVGEFCLAWEWSSQERQQVEMKRGNCRKRRMRFFGESADCQLLGADRCMECGMRLGRCRMIP